MERIRRPETKWRSARLLIAAAILLFMLPSCARLEGSANRASASDEAPWTAFLLEGEKELQRNNFRAAERALHQAYVAALESRLWKGMVEAGDGYVRIGETPKARRCYLNALFWARGKGSLDGVLRVAAAFAALGDREMAAQALVIGQRLADQTRDPEARDLVYLVRERLTPGYQMKSLKHS
jgi:hypothetical protein